MAHQSPSSLGCTCTDLINWMAERQLSQCGHGEGFTQQVSAQEVSVVLMHQKFRIPHPGLGQQPVPLAVSGQKDGIIGPRSLAELRLKTMRWNSRPMAGGDPRPWIPVPNSPGLPKAL